jgi:hypothetical protein
MEVCLPLSTRSAKGRSLGLAKAASSRVLVLAYVASRRWALRCGATNAGKRVAAHKIHKSPSPIGLCATSLGVLTVPGLLTWRSSHPARAGSQRLRSSLRLTPAAARPATRLAPTYNSQHRRATHPTPHLLRLPMPRARRMRPLTPTQP